MSATESSPSRRPEAADGMRRFAIWIAFAAALVVLPWLFPSRLGITILNEMGISIIFALSYNMLLGQGGMLSFGHAVYFGLGGFMSVHMMNLIGDNHLPIPVALLPLAGAAGGLVFGIVFGSFSTNRAGTVFAMISLGIAELVASMSLIATGFFGGEEGITGNRTDGLPLFGFKLSRDVEVYHVIAFWAFVSVVLMYLFSRTPLGRMANAVRDNPERAQFVGYSQKMVRFLSFAAAGLFAGIAGALFAINYEILTEETLGLNSSGIVLLMAYVGGVGIFAGPIIGAVVFVLLKTLLSNYTEIWAFYVGIVFLCTVLYAPAGLTGILMMHGPATRNRKLGTLVLPYLKAGIPAAAGTFGVIALLEMSNHANNMTAGASKMSLFGIALDVATPLPWIVAGALALGGFFATRALAPGVAAAWEAATKMRKEQRS